MSVINLAAVKGYLRVTQAADDALLQGLLDSAEDEALRFTNRTQLPTLPLDYPPVIGANGVTAPEQVPGTSDPVAPSVFTAVCVLVKADYDAVDAQEAAALRRVFETKLMPYRARLGV